MAAFKLTGTSSHLDKDDIDTVWRLQYAIAAVILALLCGYRFYKLRESKVWEQRGPALQIITEEDGISVHEEGASNGTTSPGWDVKSNLLGMADRFYLDVLPEEPVVRPSKLTVLKVFMTTMWHRLIGTSVGWLVWDVAFYGV
jgi:hypothetical protein